MPPPNRNLVSSAGITIDAATGERYVPSSLRADGSKRREIRVRPGYKPPEDVALYKARAAEAWKNRGKAGVPGAEGLSNDEESSSTGSGNNKNAKRREARRKAKTIGTNQEEQEQGQGQDLSSSVNGTTTTTKDKNDVAATDKRCSFSANGDCGKKPGTSQKQAKQPVDQEVENDKKARNLKKKLRQAHELNEKKDKGESLLPEQLEKVIKIQELIRQLDSLGLDANGEEKSPAEGKEKD